MPKLFSLDSDEIEKGIVNGGGGNKSLESRDLFWDRIVAYLAGLVIGLAALDLFSQLLQGESVVACDLSEYSGSLAGSDLNYVLSLCTRSLPLVQYLPAVILAQGILILIPHFVWKASFNSHFVSFFGRAKCLEELRNVEIGLYSYRNKRIIRQLKTTFSAYNSSTIFYWYKIKLVFQLFCITASIITVTAFEELRSFGKTFDCTPPEDMTWPLGNVTPSCIFTSLRLFQLIWVFDLILVGLMFPLLFWGLIWCFKRHPNALGYKSIAKFSFSTGLPQEYYRPKSAFSGLIKRGYRSAAHFQEELLNRFKFPSIANDFDFLVILLSSVDSGLGSTFREGQVVLELERLYQVDHQKLNAHVAYHKDRDYYGQETEPALPSLMWRFKNEVYNLDFKGVNSDQKLLIPKVIQGAVIGYGLLCEGSKYTQNGKPRLPLAVEVTFGSSGFSLSLARVFQQIGRLWRSKEGNNRWHLT